MILLSDRLTLRLASKSDISTLTENVFSDAEVMRYLFNGVPLSQPEAEKFISTKLLFSPADTGFLVLVEKHSDAVIGFGGLIECNYDSHPELEFGYVLARHAWGKGYATEIGAAQLKSGFELHGSMHLYANVHRDNVSSIHVLNKLNLTLYREAAGERLDRLVYRIDRDSWAANQPAVITA